MHLYNQPVKPPHFTYIWNKTCILSVTSPETSPLCCCDVYFATVLIDLGSNLAEKQLQHLLCLLHTNPVILISVLQYHFALYETHFNSTFG